MSSRLLMPVFLTFNFVIFGECGCTNYMHMGIDSRVTKVMCQT